MSGTPEIASSIEAFARLCAAIGDPLAAPGPLLSAARVDARTFARVAEAWEARFRSDGEAGLQLYRRFVEVYQEARGGEVSLATPVAAPSALDDSTEDGDGHATQPVDTRELLRRVLPFGPPGSSPVAGAAIPPPRTPVHEDHAGETALLPTNGARRRLVRFDPQTGQPLARPYWEDLPPPSRPHQLPRR